MTQFMKVATLNEIPAVSIEGLKVEGHDIVLVNSGGQIYALSNICTHAFCYMSYGQVEDTTITCSCHGAEFCLMDGISLSFLAKGPLAAYDVLFEGNDIKVGVP